MDTETNASNVGHKPPPLNSDQLNYLIWRYLQEAGYGEAAVKLQRDWKVDTGSLPFAKHIKGQALINLVQKGLKFHHLSLTFDENGQQTRPLSPSMFYFGPESAGTEGPNVQREALLKAPDANRGVSPASTVANATKLKSRDNASAAPEEAIPTAAKRGRKPGPTSVGDRNGGTSRKVSGSGDVEAPNGHVGPSNPTHDVTSPSVPENANHENTVVNGNHDDKMDLDPEINADAVDVVMEEHVEEQLPPLLPTLTNGVSQGIQVAPAKVMNLVPNSAILSLDSSQSISRAVWQPAHNAILTAQSDEYCGYWNLSGQDLQPESVKPLPQNLFPADDAGLVTAAAWNFEGSVLAVATFSEGEGQIRLFEGRELTFLENLPASQRAVTMLKWHSTGAHLLGVSPDDDEKREGTKAASTLLVWDLSSGQGSTEPNSLCLPSTIFDIDTERGSSHSTIYAAGENTVYRCDRSDQIRIGQQWESQTSQAQQLWTMIRCAGANNSEEVIIAAAAETATLWLPTKDLVREHVHSAPLTSLEIRPRTHLTNGAYQTVDFATSSEDGSLRVWQIRGNENDLSCIHELRFDPVSPVMSLAFSSDGFCLAGAGYSHARIWNAEHEYNLMATWEGTEPEWQGSSIRDDELASSTDRTSANGDGSAGVQHSLTWHTDSKRLAFGLGSHVAIINFQR